MRAVYEREIFYKTNINSRRFRPYLLSPFPNPCQWSFTSVYRAPLIAVTVIQNCALYSSQYLRLYHARLFFKTSDSRGTTTVYVTHLHLYIYSITSRKKKISYMFRYIRLYMKHVRRYTKNIWTYMIANMVIYYLI